MNQERGQTNSYHPDIPLFLALIPFISAFNYYLTYTDIRLSWFLLLTFSIDTVQGYAAWWAVRSIIIYLDKRWPYQQGGLKRIVFQIGATTVIGLLVISVLTELVSWIAKGKPAQVSFYTVDLFIISIWFLVINGIYIGLYYYNEWQRSELKRKEEQRIKYEGFMVKSGKRDVKISFKALVGFYVDGDYTIAVDNEGRKYYLDDSLDKIEQKLPTAFFFRLNRQYILHRQQVSGYARAENGKLRVLLHSNEHFPPDIAVSRTKAPQFKNWFQPE
ncbi:putative two-component response regulator [Fulvivirga imtechensis AK7]|uniref:Putative two-component response regulator n=1 Tax=Fulvivirga imtechensis AK7 TaxID=1237149 RepID=L8JNQ1_9BACT|nr:LytTR family DNA-binding domain-containing protein [Fulvivirga imtechensis]ELR69007.1 putative two-component response regulator [Fulvivirga imtechensis AK7]